ncbi:hypothetical protein AVEN_176716-1 [Araneus ventricosus]|uniref:Histone-lysine N-methyltransferase SETMAR n=1 Tax=Araneus ventricosus TaxID=182803 RepID=A0A4Y2W150_ARAVE|nr:hypothetical protein AVEN_176716-1 [Araneus ventricosus]
MLIPSASCIVLFTFFKQQKAGFNAIVSCQTLQQLQRSILTSGVIFIRDNACPYSAVVTQQLLEHFKWDVSDHPAHSPNLTTSDFHLFPELKNQLGGQSFQKNEEIQSSVKAHLTSLAATFSKRRSVTLSTDMTNA